MPDSKTTTSVAGVESYLAQTEIAMEFAALRNKDHCPRGIYVIPSTESMFLWDAALFVHQGYYADSVLKFQLKFPADYPARAPSVVFLADVFHPLISQQDGQLNLAPRFSRWIPKHDHSFDILHWVKLAFKKDVLDGLKENDCVNKEAFRLYHDKTSSFAALAAQSATLSRSANTLFDGKGASSTDNSRLNGFHFGETQEEDLTGMRSRLGLGAWKDGDTI